MSQPGEASLDDGGQTDSPMSLSPDASTFVGSDIATEKADGSEVDVDQSSRPSQAQSTMPSVESDETETNKDETGAGNMDIPWGPNDTLPTRPDFLGYSFRRHPQLAKQCPLDFELPTRFDGPYGMRQARTVAPGQLPKHYRRARSPLHGTLLQVPISMEHLEDSFAVEHVAKDMLTRVMFHVIASVFNDERFRSAEDHARAIRTLEPFRVDIVAHDINQVSPVQYQRGADLVGEIVSRCSLLASVPVDLPTISLPFWYFVRSTRLEAALPDYFPTQWPALLKYHSRQPHPRAPRPSFGGDLSHYHECTLQKHVCLEDEEVFVFFRFAQKESLRTDVEGLQMHGGGQWATHNALDDAL